ncbi:UNVERIFIED_ORG: hypothetical protein J2X80_001276 [Pseudomonas fluorescens]|mgnify:CR=1 FL=1|uniref:hypothetical protein n=1 Tax=Pseudomonas TaxID=286 RepID=UPI0007DE1834|nr:MULTISPECIES: hypothetical protein [unclassified Pseudomonas]ANI54503.1 hypothetical protein PDR5_27730 [Pseudomonas sp. DR 5-09]MDP9709203.1 hypothetical protein [Pseudomonas fluorescens]QZD73942.1 hypothetical protein K3819_14175 [Pseudomonas sp. 3-2]
MTIGYTGAWQPKAGLLVRDTGSSSKPVSQSVKVKQMLALVGNDPNAISIAEMDKQGLHKNIKGFDPTNVSAKQLGSLSAMLRSRGLISEVTSITLLNAGDKFDRFGIQKDPDAKFNALEYFATQLDTIQNNNLKGNKYANTLIPEYKKAIYVLQNLQTYGQGGERKPPTDKGVSAKA